MEVKKSPKANLESKRSMFFQIGTVITLLIVILAFSWSSTDKQNSLIEATAAAPIEEEIVPITQEQNIPPPPQLTAPVLSDQIEIVSDDIHLDIEMNINTEDNASLAVEIRDYAQTTNVQEVIEEEEAVPFMVVENKPTFQGHEEDSYFRNWVHSQLAYPESAIENGVQGRVTVQFTIQTDGSVKDVKVLRGVDAALDKEAVRVISSSPRWEPGKQRNKAVKVSYIFPVVFELR